MSCANKLTAAVFAVIITVSAACIGAGAWHWSGNVVSEAACSAKAVALTFDDGPHPKKTPEILEILDKYDIRATFFAVGENAEAYPEIVRAEIDAGHEIGNHTYTHVFLKNADCEKAKREICAFDDYMLEEFEYKPKLLRPPGRAVQRQRLHICREHGLLSDTVVRGHTRLGAYLCRCDCGHYT